MGKKRGCATLGCIFRDCRHGAASATRAGGGGDATLFGSQGNVDSVRRSAVLQRRGWAQTSSPGDVDVSSWHPYLNEFSLVMKIYTDIQYNVQMFALFFPLVLKCFSRQPQKGGRRNSEQVRKIRPEQRGVRRLEVLLAARHRLQSVILDVNNPIRGRRVAIAQNGSLKVQSKSIKT